MKIPPDSMVPSLFRQSFVVAAVLILSGIVLGYYVYPAFLLLSVLVSGGLLFSAVVGFCPMAIILRHMPWNTR